MKYRIECEEMLHWKVKVCANNSYRLGKKLSMKRNFQYLKVLRNSETFCFQIRLKLLRRYCGILHLECHNVLKYFRTLAGVDRKLSANGNINFTFLND